MLATSTTSLSPHTFWNTSSSTFDVSSQTSLMFFYSTSTACQCIARQHIERKEGGLLDAARVRTSEKAGAAIFRWRFHSSPSVTRMFVPNVASRRYDDVGFGKRARAPTISCARARSLDQFMVASVSREDHWLVSRGRRCM